jgi:hypothetical protein
MLAAGRVIFRRNLCTLPVKPASPAGGAGPFSPFCSKIPAITSVPAQACE